MEKLCIVRRRKKSLQEVGKEVIHELMDNGSMCREKESSLENLSGENDNVLSFPLTPEQCGFVRSNNHIKSIINGTSHGFHLDMQDYENGHIIFKFCFDKVDIEKMLKTEHVCQMLQVSKSFLMKLVKEKEIRSYKMGRLRRFSLKDILEYLTEKIDHTA
ncbi:MAG: DNA-binding protein [Candidatus Brocadia sp.]|nr:DNA-binding protein [Candidatus Brocadia sp.]